MSIKSKIVKVAVTSLAAGGLLIGGLAGVSTASADNPWGAEPGSSATASWFTRYFYNGYNPYTGQTVYYVNGVPTYNPYNYNVYNSWAYNNSWLSYFYNYAGYNYNAIYGLAGYNQSINSSVISASASALGLTTQDVTARLASGKTLAQIAADRGVARVNFVNSVNSILQGQISAAVQSRLLTPAAGVTLSAAVASQVNGIVDRSGPALLAGI